MIKLFALLTVFILCSPAYGEILVYKISGNIDGIDLETEGDVKMKLRGYLLIDMDFSQDEIAGSTLILRGSDDSQTALQETIENIVFDGKGKELDFVVVVVLVFAQVSVR